MKFLCSAVILILASVALNVQAKPSSVQTQLQGALDKYLVNANVNARDFDISVSADVTSQCFALYLPMLNEVAATFSSSYQSCISIANEELANLTAQALKDQTVYQQEVSTLCGAFTSCDQSSGNDTSTFFQCYATAAQDDVSVIYDIATSAASTANTLSQAIQATQDTEYQCTNTTENNYVRDTAATYDLLDSCLKNGLPTTSTAATTAGTTPAPSTLATTQSPASTAADVTADTTAAADESSAAPVAASTAASNKA